MKRAATYAVSMMLCFTMLSAATEAKRYKRNNTNQVQQAKTVKQALPHPKGCPPTLFCGCGAAFEIFGRPIRELFLAANWFKFPKATEPKPGYVAVKQHHVFTIKKVINKNTVVAINHNGKGHKSYVQVMSLNGYSVRNPKG